MKKPLYKVSQYGFLMLASFISLYPFYWLLVSTTNSSREVIEGKLWFGNFFKSNLINLFQQINLPLFFYNTLKIALVSSLFSILFTSLAAYGFQFFKSKGREKLYNTLLVSMMVPFSALMIPLFKTIVYLGLYDTHLAIILPTIANVFLIFFFRQNFKSFPYALVEVARIDGANELKIFFQIVVPLMKPSYAAAGIYSFMMYWNNYLWALIVLQSSEQKTLTLLISSLSSAYAPDYGVTSLAILIATLPIIVVFFTLQKHFVAGMTGALKH